MKIDIWMPIYINDYLSDTMRLDAEKHGVYFLLMMDYWKHGEIPSDKNELSLIARVPIGSKSLDYILEKFFHFKDEKWIHNRIDRELRIAKERRDKAIENGKKGGRPPKNKKQNETQIETKQEPTGEPTSKPIAYGAGYENTNLEVIDSGDVKFNKELSKCDKMEDKPDGYSLGYVVGSENAENKNPEKSSSPFTDINNSYKEKNIKKESSVKSLIESDFEEIYSHYPVKKGKSDALKKYLSYRKKKNIPEKENLINHIEESKKTKQWISGYIPHFSTWMNQRRWEDEISESVVTDKFHTGGGEIDW